MAWLIGWTHRVKLTTDSGVIDDDLLFFPICVRLGDSVGITSADVSFVFDELGSNDNRLKIAVTKADGTSELYVEIEHWDHLNETAILHVSKSDWTLLGAGEDLYLYFDSIHVDNDTYVSDAPNTDVWNANYNLVNHLNCYNWEAYKEANGVITAVAGFNYYIGEPRILYRNDQFEMWAHVLTNRAGWKDDIFYFTSDNGIAWSAGIVALQNGSRHSVLYNDVEEKYLLYAKNNATNAIDLYTSDTQTGFILDTANCIVRGGAGAWDDTGMGDNFVWKEGATWYMIYSAGSGGIWKIGLATSADGRSWDKDVGNPIEVTGWFGTDSGGGIDYVIKYGDYWYALLSGKPDNCGFGVFGHDGYIAKTDDLTGPWTVIGGAKCTFLSRTKVWEGASDPDEGQAVLKHVVEHDGFSWFYTHGRSSQPPDVGHVDRIGLLKLPYSLEELFTSHPAYINDVTTNAYEVHATDSMRPSLSPLVNGGSYLSGTNSRISMGNILNYERTDPFTLEACVKLSTGADYPVVMGKREAGLGYPGYLLYIRDLTGFVGFYLKNSNANALEVWETDISVIDDALHHIVVTYDGSSDESGVAIYVDGEPRAINVAFNTLDASVLNAADFIFGYYDAQPLLGDMDESRISDGVLSAAWNKGTYNSLFDSLLTYGTQEDAPIIGYSYASPVPKLIAAGII